jgi:hypothetical protein
LYFQCTGVSPDALKGPLNFSERFFSGETIHFAGELPVQHIADFAQRTGRELASERPGQVIESLNLDIEIPRPAEQFGRFAQVFRKALASFSGRVFADQDQNGPNLFKVFSSGMNRHRDSTILQARACSINLFDYEPRNRS